jgi:urea transporter
MNQRIVPIFTAISEIVCIPSPVFGAVLALALIFVPQVLIMGLLSLASAWLFAFFLGRGRLLLIHRVYLYNPLLVGFSIGYFYDPTLAVALVALVAGIITLVLSVGLNHVFYTFFKLPILSLPFFMVTNLILLAVPAFSTRVLGPETILPAWAPGYLTALGAIFFIPYPLCGAIIALGILGHSRILFLFSIIGYFTGTAATALVQGSGSAVFSDLSQFNFILIAMAVGAFLIPSPKTYLLSIMAVMGAAITTTALSTLLSPLGIQVLTLPFILVFLLSLYFLGVIDSNLLAKEIKSSPEETLDTYLFQDRRLKGNRPGISRPFEGEWSVWQGAAGQWTHQGSYCNAIDFIIIDEAGSPHRGDGYHLQDYHCFGKPVLSPVSGRVISLANGIPDNPVGRVDTENNWGNHVILQAEAGFFVELSHLSQGSIQVRKGDWVTRGDLLGHCGNSGYSPQPHLHIQVQESGLLGASTQPFCFSGFIQASEYRINSLPCVGTLIKPVSPKKGQRFCQTYLLDDCLYFKVFQGTQKIQDLALTVKMDQNGKTYFDSGRGQLFFYEDPSGFFFYEISGNDPFLRRMFKALPSHPLVLEPGTLWKDTLPTGLLTAPWKKAFQQFLSSFHHGLSGASITLVCKSKFCVEGEIKTRGRQGPEKSMVEWDAKGQLQKIQISDYTYMRVNGLESWDYQRRDSLSKNKKIASV